MSISLKTLAAFAALLIGVGSTSSAVASIQLTAMFTEQNTANSDNDSNSDLFSLTVGAGSSAVSITNVKFTTPAAVFFDTVGPGPANVAGNAGAFSVASTSGLTSALLNTAASVTDGGNMLSIDFTGTGFGAGDSVLFTIDVDDDNTVVRGFDVTDFYTSMQGTQIDVTYDSGSQTGLTASFLLDAQAGDQVQFTDNTGVRRDWYTGVSGSAQLLVVPEASSLLVWLSIGSCGLAVAGWWRRR